MMVCTAHDVQCVWKEGTSKAGKDYAFWACPEKDSEGNFCKAEKVEPGDSPAKELANKARYNAASTPDYRPPSKGPDPEARGKTRCQVAMKFIEQGFKKPDPVVIGYMEAWVDWIMTGEQPSETKEE